MSLIHLSRIVIPPMATERGIAILDHGFPSSFEINLDITATLTAYYLGQNAAVVIWLPPNSYGYLDVFRNPLSGPPPYFEFHHQVFGGSRLHVLNKETEDALANGKDVNIELGTATLSAETKKVWGVFCDGTFQYKKCRPSQHAACENDIVVCVANAPPGNGG